MIGLTLPRLRRHAPDAIASALPDLGPAPELGDVGPWLNTVDGAPVTVAGLAGNVALIEFWTFACGNCQRTLPFLRQMHDRYAPGLVVVGIHTPELAFERPLSNVRDAVRGRGVEFPVGLDNDFRAWSAYDNHYWPTQYLLDGAGRVRYGHIGEGAYRQTEAAIRTLLGEIAEPNPRDLGQTRA